MTLQEFFKENPKCALAFSGGTDSSYLLWAACHYGADVTAYYAHTVFQPEFELEDAKRLAEETGAKLRLLELDPLSSEDVRRNDARRCYYCKNAIFSNILRTAHADGYTCIIDGTNASDDAGDRPGMQALCEMGVRSPLRECGITKAQVREESRRAGLFTADKPAYACLATRIPTGEAITAEALGRIDQAETALRALGLRDFRLRKRGRGVLLQATEAQFPLVMERRAELHALLTPFFEEISLDLKPRTPSL